MQKDKKCPLCIINQAKTFVLEETKHTRVIVSNPALVKAHILVTPIRHVEKISELTKEELNDLINNVLKFQELILKKFSGCDIRQNYRPFIIQGKLKVDHCHVHLLPRELEDELYQKSMKFEKEIFRDLDINQLNKLKEFLLK